MGIANRKDKTNRLHQGEGEAPPLQKLHSPIPEEPISKNINNPFILLDYGTHGEGITGHADTEYEDTCNVKQGFLALIEKIDPADSASSNYSYP